MKILQVSTYYPPNFGGIEQVAYDLSCILKKQGNEVKVICFNNSNQTISNTYDGVEVVRIGYKSKIASQAISLRYFFKLKEVIKKFKPDIIHIHLPNPLIATYLLVLKPKCKIILHWHSDIIKQKHLKMVYAPLENAILQRADSIVATSRMYAEKSDALRRFLNKVVVIPNIVETEFLDTVSVENINRITEIRDKYLGKKIIFFIGVHREYKGLRYLIESCQYLSDDYVVLIAGNGPLTENLKQKAVDLNLGNIEFVGRISDEEKKCYLLTADVFAFPSITKNEAFGIALAEALYCGLPAVTFHIDGSGVNWVNQDSVTGIEVKHFSAQEYALALMNVSREKYGENAQRWVRENFTEKVIWNVVKQLFNTV